MSTISLVCIAKNEEKVLERMIESVKEICDEIIVVDTGSTDKTKEIIAKYGKVYEIPFENFVTTKNKALQLAKCDYILFMDCDEVVVEGLEYLKEYTTSGFDCVFAKIIEDDNTHHFRARLWCNNGKWRYGGPNVHEALEGIGSVNTDHRIIVRHNHGHRTYESYMTRSNQYIGLLNAYLQEHHNDSRALFYLGRTYKDMNEWLRAIEHYRKYLDMNVPFLDERFQASYDIAECFKVQGEYTQSFAACENAKKIDPRRAEIYVLAGTMYMNMQDWDNAIIEFEKASNLPIPTDVLLFMNPKMYNEIPLDHLMVCLDKKKEYRKAGDVTKKLLDINQGPPDQRMVNNMNFLNKMQNKIIFFALGATPEPVWGSMMEEVGLGGLEQTYISLPIAMVARGHTCFVFCKTPQDNIYKGVYFVQYEKLATEYKNWHPDVIVSSRWWDSFYMFPSAKKIQWAQDSHYPNPSKADGWATIDAFVCSSEWHKHYTAEMVGLGLDAKKINVIPLSINPKLFENKNIERNPKQVIYGSNPSRGLDVLQGIWKELTDKVPDITLKVCYGFEGLKTWSGDVVWLAKQEEDEKRIRDWAKESGNVYITGRLTKDQFANEILSSSLCLYPCTFPETYCLVSLEMQAGGVPSVSSKLGALSTTLSNSCNILLEGNPFGKDYQDKFIQETIKLLNDSKKLYKLSKECAEFYHRQPTWESVAEMWEKIIYNI